MSSRTARRVPMLAAGLLSAACGVWLGLVRIGWALPLPWPDQLIDHGPLMVCGFLGTVISLERAVGFGSGWGYAAPVLTASGAVLLDVGPAGPAAALLVTAGSLVVVAMFVAICRRQPALFAWTMGAGAVAWVVGNAQWAAGAPIYRVVFWWVAFLVLTIAGERLELNRVLQPRPLVRAAFVGALAIVVFGVAAARWWPAEGVRAMGAGLLALTAWLVVNDVARRTIRQRGVTRFMAFTLLGGYAWLGIGGGLSLAAGAATPGLPYDAALHAVFLGFAMSMVFAHAPVIFPAVLGVGLAFRSRSYLHVGVLHVSLALRIAGDLVDELGRWRVWGGLLNALALLLFVANTVASITWNPERIRSRDAI